MMEFVRVGRSPEELATGFEPSADTTRSWGSRPDIEEGLRADGRSERDFGGFAARSGSSRWSKRSWEEPRLGSPGSRMRFRMREGAPGHVPGDVDVRRAGGLPKRLPRLAGRRTSPRGTRRTGCFSGRSRPSRRKATGRTARAADASRAPRSWRPGQPEPSGQDDASGRPPGSEPSPGVRTGSRNREEAAAGDLLNRDFSAPRRDPQPLDPVKERVQGGI
jgi:hypothetical protein